VCKALRVNSKGTDMGLLMTGPLWSVAKGAEGRNGSKKSFRLATINAKELC